MFFRLAESQPKYTKWEWEEILTVEQAQEVNLWFKTQPELQGPAFIVATLRNIAEEYHNNWTPNKLLGIEVEQLSDEQKKRQQEIYEAKVKRLKEKKNQHV